MDGATEYLASSASLVREAAGDRCQKRTLQRLVDQQAIQLVPRSIEHRLDQAQRLIGRHEALRRRLVNTLSVRAPRIAWD